MDAQQLIQELSRQMDVVIPHICHNAKRINGHWRVGDLDGNPSTKSGSPRGGSTCFFRGEGGIVFAKDYATDETINIANAWGRMKLKTDAWGDILQDIRDYLGVHYVEPVRKAEKPKPVSSSTCGAMRGTPEYDYCTKVRGLQEKTLQQYKVRSHSRKSPFNTHFIAFRYWDSSVIGLDQLPEPLWIKSTGIEKPSGKKDIWSTPQYATLWGWWLVDRNTRTIAIAEGEWDAMSIAQMMHEEKIDGIPVLSMPSGASNLQWIENDYAALQQFETIYLFCDHDEPGEKAAQNIAKRLGLARCKRVSLCRFKDANELLLSKERGTTMRGLLESAKCYNPPSMIGCVDSAEEAIRRNEELSEARAHRDFVFPQLPFKLCPRDTTILTGSCGSGKALDIDTPIPTPSGFKKMGDLSVGDLVIGMDGKATKITYASPYFYDHECYKVKFDDGSEITADADHRWMVQTIQDQRSGRHRVLTTTEIIDLNQTVSIPLCSPIEGDDKKDLPIPPYTLGVWLGDGSSTRSAVFIGHKDVEILRHIQDDGFIVKHRPNSCEYEYGVNSGLHVQLKKCGLYGNKHIPEAYFYADYDSRLALLQGLIDTDGHIDRGGRVEYCSTKKKLAMGVYRLALTLGIKATIRENEARLYGRYISQRWRVYFTATLPCSRLSRHLCRIKSKVRNTLFRRYIKSIKPCKTVTTRCIAVDNNDHMYLCGESYIPTHNTDLAQQIMLHEISKGEIVCIAAYDTPKDDLLILSAWQIVGREPTSEDIMDAAKALEGKLYFIDGVDNDVPADQLFQDMDYACRRFGCTRFLIDNLHFIVDKENYEGQDAFTRKLDKFDKTHGTHSILVAHALTSADTETRIPGRADVEGSKGMVKVVQNGITIFRNKVKEKADEYDEGDKTPKRIKRFLEGSDAYISCWKQRNGFREEFVHELKFDKRMRRFATTFGRFEAPFVPQKEEEITSF